MEKLIGQFIQIKKYATLQEVHIKLGYRRYKFKTAWMLATTKENFRYLNINNNIILNLSDYNQIYYFASPKILKNFKKNLDKRPYNKYYALYVQCFKNILDKAQQYENIKTCF